MTDERGRHDDPVDPSDWLSAQFGSDDEPDDEPRASEKQHATDRPRASDEPPTTDELYFSDESSAPGHEPAPWASGSHPVSAAHPVAEAIPVIPAVPVVPVVPPATPTFSPPTPGGVFSWGLTPTSAAQSSDVSPAADSPGADSSDADSSDADSSDDDSTSSDVSSDDTSAAKPDTEALTFTEAITFSGTGSHAEPWPLDPPTPPVSAPSTSAPLTDAPSVDLFAADPFAADPFAADPFATSILAVPADDIHEAPAADTPSADTPAGTSEADTALSEVPPDASLAGGQSQDFGVPTVAFAWEGTATELFAPAAPTASVADPATELLGGIAGHSAGNSRESGPGSVDALFGGMGVPRDTGRIRATAAIPASPTRDKPARSQLVLVWVAVALVALLALAVLFFIGTRASQLTGAAPVVVVSPSVSAKPSPTPSATPTVQPVGPVAVGTYKWDALRGGECLAPYDSAWAEKFTVVDCATPHPAQMVARGTFPGADVTSAPYPGADALQAQINLLCTAPSVIDLGAAGAYNDIQIAGSFPADEKQWTGGARSYYCFVTRSSGQPLTTSVTVPPAAPAA
ncbi:MAG: hypothetical protein JWO01_2764 [Microbacteriaceae bacterium]|nr:hypothetical protein [Microbacteriaceae bacterium]